MLIRERNPFEFISFDNDDGGAGGSTPPETPPADPQGSTPPEGEPQGKTFTQEELNSILAKDKKSTRNSLLRELGIDNPDEAKSALEAAREYRRSQQSKEEQLAADLAEKDTALNDAISRADAAEAKVAAMVAGVDSKFIDKAVKLMGTYEGETVTEKIEALLLDLPELKSKAVTTGPANTGGKGSNGEKLEGMAATEAEIRRIAGLS